jgi:nicotinamide riboside kinase
MKIGITGSHSVGKTTLLNALRSEPCFKDYKICDEVTRQVRALGVNINENGNDNTQRLIMMKHLENVFLHDKMITDRTALDCLVYSRYLWARGQVSSETMYHITDMFNKMWHMYSVVFYIEPEFDVVDDGVRSIDAAFRDDINHAFRQAIAELKLHKDNFHLVKGSVVSRVNQVMNVYERIQYGEYGKV